MDIDKVRALTDTELGLELTTQRRQLYDLRFQLATRQLTDHSQLTQTRRTIARVLTVMTERGLDETIVPRQTVEARKPAARGRSRAAAGAKSTTSTRTTSRSTSRSTTTKSKEAETTASGGNDE
jgi:large subunit ribosomal protein L29